MYETRIINKNIPLNLLYYLAGVVDCSSSFSIVRKKRNTKYAWRGMIRIATADSAVQSFLNNILFNGTASIVKSSSSIPHGRHRNTLTIDGAALDFLLPQIEPLLINKKEQCRILMEFRNTINRTNSEALDEETLEKRELLLQNMLQVNSLPYKKSISSPLSPST
jgi:hypothetical protein